jgi:cobalt-zinc-cadmium efflux system outer membrane protein
MSGADMWSASVGINLPWLYRRQTVDREVEAARAMYAAAQQEREVTRNKVTSRVAEMVIEALRSEEQLSLVETGLLPQAAGALAASHAGYSSGKGDITSLLNDHMNIYNLQRQRTMLIAEHERSLATLDYLVGQPLAPAQTAEEVPAGGD